MMDSDDDVECEPRAPHRDHPSVIVRRTDVRPCFGRVEFADISAVLDRSRHPRHAAPLPWISPRSSSPHLSFCRIDRAAAAWTGPADLEYTIFLDLDVMREIRGLGV